MKCFIILSHDLTDAQKQELTGMGVTEFVELSPERKKLWANIPPDVNRMGLIEHLAPITTSIYGSITPRDIAVVQGESGASYHVVGSLQIQGVGCYHATTKRVIEETIDMDGNFKKISTFQHVRFRKY